MPIDYHIDPATHLLHAVLRGRVTLAEVRDFATASVADAHYSPDLVEIVDASALTDPDIAAAAFDAARVTTEVLTEVIAARRVLARAIIAPTPMLFELARNYADATSRSGTRMRVFHDAASAITWARRTAAGSAGPPPS